MVVNLKKNLMQILQHQVVAFIHIVPVTKLKFFHDFGGLDKFGINEDSPMLGAQAVYDRALLSGLFKDQKDKVIRLLTGMEIYLLKITMTWVAPLMSIIG